MPIEYPIESCGAPGGAGDIMGVAVPCDPGPILYGDAPAESVKNQIKTYKQTMTKKES